MANLVNIDCFSIANGVVACQVYYYINRRLLLRLAVHNTTLVNNIYMNLT